MEPSIDKRKSFISEQATNSYTQVGLQLANETKITDSSEATILCAISLETPYDLKQYFSWIAIPSGNRLPPKIYSLNGLKMYLDASDAFNNPDPVRILPSLKHMKTRVNRYLSLPENIKSIPASDVNLEFKTKLLNQLLQTWLEGKRDDNLEKMGILLTIGLWFDAGYIQCLNFKEAETCLTKAGKIPKSFIIRKSSLSDDKGAGDCTVFTISHVLDNGDIWNVRILDVHGVGLYCITYPFEKKIASYYIGDTVATSDMRTALELLKYVPPTYACFTDLLIDFADKKFIDLSRLLKM